MICQGSKIKTTICHGTVVRNLFIVPFIVDELKSEFFVIFVINGLVKNNF